jgi:hypothetical protein
MRVPKKPFSWEEKFVQAAKRRNWRANLNQKQRQQVAGEAIKVAAVMLAY